MTEQERVKEFMEGLGYEQTLYGNYSGHEEMISSDISWQEDHEPGRVVRLKAHDLLARKSVL